MGSQTKHGYLVPLLVVLQVGRMDQSTIAQQKPTFTYTGPTQPGWGYASPLALAVVWFSADQTLAPGSTAGTYMTSPGEWQLPHVHYLPCHALTVPCCSGCACMPGGQVVDVINGTAGSVTIRGYVPATDAFASNTTSIELCTHACGLQPACTATAQAQNAPRCNLYAVDLSYSGSEGLITDKWGSVQNHALPCHPLPGCAAPLTHACVGHAGTVRCWSWAAPAR